MGKKIGIVVSSLRHNSFSKLTANAFAKLLPEGFEAKYIEIDDLPFYNQDLETDKDLPESWARLRKEIKEVDGVYFFTPEYNRSIPAVLKNALDVGSRPFGKSAWAGKPALVVSVSPGALSAFGANHHLRQILTVLDMPTLQQPEAYIGNITSLLNEDGTFVEDTTKFFQIITDKYVDFLNRLTD
ncbi:MAG: NAD(P)H-dependent oxidoreductase [Micrococcaceae bacterium]